MVKLFLSLISAVFLLGTLGLIVCVLLIDDTEEM